MTCSLDPDGGRRIRKGIRRRRSRVGSSGKTWWTEKWKEREKGLMNGKFTFTARWFGRWDKSYLHVLSTWNELQLKYIESQISFASQTNGRCKEPTSPPHQKQTSPCFDPIQGEGIFFESFIFLHDLNCWINIFIKQAYLLTLTLSYVVKSIKNMKKYIKVHLEQKKMGQKIAN